MDTKNKENRQDPCVTHVLDEIIDIEEYAHRGEKPPSGEGVQAEDQRARNT